MYKSLKNLFLLLLKYSGIFRICRYLNRGRPRIICYHGFNIVDESSFIPGTFIDKATFEERIKKMNQMGASFIGLASVFEEQSDELPIILTFDDGFLSTLTEGLPILEKYKIPATLYVTSYYQKKGNPIFRLHMQYLKWKCPEFELSWDTIKEYEENKTEEERVLFAKKAQQELGFELSADQLRKSFTIADDKQLLEAQKSYFDIQLHTHRHRLPLEREGVLKEIDENREVLSTFTDGPLVHFCYPSGIYDRKQFPWLEEAGVKTATTLVPGIVKKNSHPLELPRILDSEAITMLQFEAELCGVGDLLRSLKGR